MAVRCSACLLAFALALLAQSDAEAHCFVGARFLPATLNVDDPCVADELSLPTVSAFKTGDEPAARELDISAEYSKRITETFGVSVGSTWTRLRPPGSPSASGFQNVETSFKWQFLTDGAHERVMSTAVVVDWENTGAGGVGAESFSTITPTFFVGQGFGELPDSISWAKPLAVTGQIGYAVPSRTTSTLIDSDTGAITRELNPQFLVYGASLQYSMPYLKSNVIDLGLPDVITRLIPVVEAQFTTPVANNFGTGIGTTGTVNPGVIYVGDKFQIGLEAIVPINRASGTGVGALAQLHLYLDDMFPTTIGRPLFANSAAAGTPGR